MSMRQVKNWYTVLIVELLGTGSFFLGISFFAENLHIDSGGNWGWGRILVAMLGFVFGIIGIGMCLPAIRMIFQTYKTARFVRYYHESAIWILLVLGLCEFLLRTTLSRYPENEYDKDWGIMPVANSTWFWGKEGYAITHYLEHGEIATPFSEGSISVVVLGDSNTEALQVPDNVKYVSVVETTLRSRGKNVDLHNLGMSGNSIPDYIYYAPLIKRFYNPEIVVVQLSPQDFYGEDGGDGYNSDHRNYFVVNDSGNLEVHHKEQSSFSMYGKLLSRNMMYILGRSRYIQMTESVKTKKEDQVPTTYNYASVILPVARLDDQLNLLKEAYSGVKVILLILPYSPNLDNDQIVFTDAKSFQMLKISAEDSGEFYVVSPQVEFYDLVNQDVLPRGFMNSLPGQGHMNKFGHAIVGELLAEKILEIVN